jgi:hypothetical protein
LDTRAASRGEIELGFNILEEGDGAQVQLLYAGGTNVTAAVIGTIEGRKSILHVPYSALKPTKRGSPWLQMFLAVMLMLGLGVVIWDFIKQAHAAETMSRRLVLIVVIAIAVGALFYVEIAIIRDDILPPITAPRAPFVF